MCPSSDMAVIEVIREKYPELWDGWELRLSEWREEHGLPPGWVEEMRWRLWEDHADETHSDC